MLKLSSYQGEKSSSELCDSVQNSIGNFIFIEERERCFSAPVYKDDFVRVDIKPGAGFGHVVEYD